MKRSIASQLLRNAALLLAIGFASCLPAQDPEAEPALEAAKWTDADTKLANHYISLLQKDPAYGNVLDLLWDLYRKKDQTPLLLDYFKGAAEGETPVAKLLYAHLLRKNEEVDEARNFYSEVADLDPDNVPALKALAEISEQQNRPGKALSLYTRLVELIPIGSEEGIAIRLRKASLHRSQGQLPDAVAVWNELLEAYPTHVTLRTEIVSLLLEAGETRAAVDVLAKLSESEDPRQRLDALIELNRLYEFINDFENAVTTAREALSLLHFRNHEYSEIFGRLVRLHERFDRLEELENSLEENAKGTNPSERSLLDIAEFHKQTANPAKEEEAVARLVKQLPGRLDYRIRLVEIQIRNDHYDEAAATLETALQSQGEIPLHLTLLKARILLRGKSRKDAERLLEEKIAAGNTTPDQVLDILEFARTHYLDSLVENLLRRRIETPPPGADPSAAPIELARFLHERGRPRDAARALEDYVESAGDVTRERALRLHQSANVLRDLDLNAEALAAVDEAIALTPENVDFHATRADIFVETKSIEKAIEQLEAIWREKMTLEEKAEVDQRLFSLLRGHYSGATEEEEEEEIPSGPFQSAAQYRLAAAAASRVGRSGDEPPPPELLEYYAKIKRAANLEPGIETRYRAAWWAFKLQDNTECYQQLKTVTEESGQIILEVEKMLLELAEQYERPALMVTHLENLAKADPENADEYAQRRAEVRFELGFEDEAIRELQRLANKPDATLDTLNTLAKLYQRLGSPTRQLEVWRRAYREANVFEKRRIIKQLSTALIEAGQPEEALDAQLELLTRESDAVQRRKQLDNQLTVARSHFLLDWLLDRYRDLTRQHPFDRFYPEALARVHRAAGNTEEAFEAMKKAYYMSGQNESLLVELSQLADELGDLKSAIYYRRQLLNLGEGDDIDNWRTLVEMLEKDLRVGEAELLRERLETRFGTDPEYLSEVSEVHLKTGRYAAAQRSLEKLASLRPWDLEARFRLALLKRDRGDKAAAFEAFQQILSDTADAEYPKEFSRDALPLIQVSSFPPESGLHSSGELDPFVFTVEGFPFLGGNMQDDIVEELQEPHPHFRRLPRETHLIRLRSIEEAAALSTALGRESDWYRKFSESDRPSFEKLWAARHAALREPFAELLDSQSPARSHFGLLAEAYCRLLAGDPGSAVEWSLAPDDFASTEQPREVYTVMAALLLLKDNPKDPLLDTAAVHETLRRLPLSRTNGVHLFSELRKAGFTESALFLGETLAEEESNTDGNFLLDIAHVAERAGDENKHLEWLDRALHQMLSPSRGERGDQFLIALTERLSLLEDDPARRQFLETLDATHPLGAHASVTEKMEKDILIDIAGERYDDAVNRLGSLATRQIDFIRPADPDSEQVRYSQSQSWQRMSRLHQYYVDRIPLDRSRGRRFVENIGGGTLTMYPVERSAASQYEQFEIDRRSTLLEWNNAPERQAIVSELYGLLIERESGMDLGKTLESRGFYREAISVYQAEALREDRDYAPLQGLFDACSEALEPQAALAMIDQIHTREFPAPPGLTVDYLNQQHATFLLIDRDVERLLQLSRFPPEKDSEPSRSSQGYLPYQDALVELYRQQGEADALLRLLSHLRNRDKATSGQLLLAAETLAAAGRHEEALKWYSEIPLDHSEPNLERRAMLAAIASHEAIGWKQTEDLIELARTSLTQQPSAVTRQLADAVHRAGASSEAIGILKLLRRNTSDPRWRTATTLQLLRVEKEAGAEWSDLAEDFETLFHDFAYSTDLDEFGEQAEPSTPVLPNASRLVEWIVRAAERDPELDRILEEAPVPEAHGWLKNLLVGYLTGSLPGVARSEFGRSGSDTAERILETLPAFGPEGIEIARELVDREGKPGDFFFRNDPRRQATFFHRIGDHERLLEVHARLTREAQSDLFHQAGLDDWYATLNNRSPLPRLFEHLGETELAGSLYRAYHDTITVYQWSHQPFLNDFASFLIETGEFVEANEVLKKSFRKSIKVDLRLVMELYRASGRLADWEEHAAELFLTSGQTALLREWRAALAEGREMVNYSEPW